MNDGQVKKMRKIMQEYYPEYDIMKQKLTPSQANLIIRDSLGYRKGALKEARKSKNLTKQAGAPKVLGGRATRSPATKQDDWAYKTNVSFDERINNVKKLFQ